MSEDTMLDPVTAETDAKKIHPFFHLVTDKTNENHDLIKWLCLIGFIAAIVFQGYVVFITKVFDILVFSAGLGTLFTSVAGALRLKASTEA